MPLRFFVIDEEECIRDPIRWHLEDLGHEVITARDPTGCPVYAGHDCARDAPCGHGLFIGARLPRLGALDFIEMMEQRGCKGLARHKIIMTGNIDLLDRARAARLGCRVVQKPLTLDRIDAIVAEIAAQCDANDPLAEL